jgi:hypothetical protein
MGFLAVMKAIGYKSLYPFLLIGSPLVSSLGILIAPLVHVVTFIFQLFLLPLRVVPNLEVSRSFFSYLPLATASTVFGLILSKSYLWNRFASNPYKTQLWLNHLKSVYIFIGVATVVGIFAGFILHYSLRAAYQLFNLDPADDKDFEPERLRLARKISDRRWPLTSDNGLDNPYFGNYRLGT